MGQELLCATRLHTGVGRAHWVWAELVVCQWVRCAVLCGLCRLYYTKLVCLSPKRVAQGTRDTEQEHTNHAHAMANTHNRDSGLKLAHFP